MPGNFAASTTQPGSSQNTEDPKALASALSNASAQSFLTEILAHGLGAARGSWDADEIASRLDEPAHCLRTIYSRYAFSRRGKDRRTLADIACSALEMALGDLPLADIEIEDVWKHYCALCEATNRKSSPDLNRGVVLGLAGLARTIARENETSLARYAANAAWDIGRIETVFFGIVELRGVGPKVAATMLRDWICVYGAEDSVAFRDSIYLQPIDRWARLAAPFLLEDSSPEGFPDWILAGKLGKAARNAGVSGIRLNMGISWLGLQASSGSDPEARFLELLGRCTRE